jgi:Tfp pilus assembly protein PilF
LLGSEHPNLALVLNNLGTVLDEQNRPAEAAACYRSAFRIAERRLPPDHPTVAVIRSHVTHH